VRHSDGSCWDRRRRGLPVGVEKASAQQAASQELLFDLIPDTLPLLGEVDDVVIFVAAAHWFIRWRPADVVREHVAVIGGRAPV